MGWALGQIHFVEAGPVCPPPLLGIPLSGLGVEPSYSMLSLNAAIWFSPQVARRTTEQLVTLWPPWGWIGRMGTLGNRQVIQCWSHPYVAWMLLSLFLIKPWPLFICSYVFPSTHTVSCLQWRGLCWNQKRIYKILTTHQSIYSWPFSQQHIADF